MLSGLKQPHALHKVSEGFLVSDTNGGRLIIFDLDGQIKSTITGDFRWIQDAIMLSNGNYLVADANNHRLVEADHSGAVISVFNYSTGYKVFNVREYNIS